MVKKYRVRLSAEERAELESLVHTGKASAYKRDRAQILLKADEGEFGPGCSDAEIAHALEISRDFVESTRERLVTKGFEAALTRAIPDRSAFRKIDGEVEAKLIALCCGPAPEGRTRWTLQLLADQIVALGYAESLSYEAVRKHLKKMNLNLG